MKSLLVISCVLAMASPPLLRKPSDGNLQAGWLTISSQGQKLILDHEVGGGKPYYVRCLQRPSWPEGQSGVTVGIGYDAGYNTREQIAKDWGDKLPAGIVARLQSCAGIKGQAAKLKCRSLQDIVIPWEAALEVYQQRTIPRFSLLTKSAYPGVETLHPSVQGAYLSWVFNRGNGISNSSRDLEKRLIRRDTPNAIKQVPSHILASQRLWIGTPNGNGLCRRRRAEAALIQSTLH